MKRYGSIFTALVLAVSVALCMVGCAGLLEAMEAPGSWQSWGTAPGAPPDASGANNLIGGVMDVLVPWIPMPVRIPLLLGAALVGTVVRMIRSRHGLVSVVKSIDAAMRSDPAFARAFRAHADTFRAIQTTGASRLVDKIAGRGVTTRLGA